MLFVCEDNDFAVHTRKAQRQGFKSIVDVVRQYDCAVYEDDTNDVESVYGLVRGAVSQLHAERRPAFFNIRTYRYLEPCGTAMDSSAPYRTAEEDAFWKGRDCVALQRRRLLNQGTPDSKIVAIEKEIDTAIERSVAAAKAAHHPSADL